MIGQQMRQITPNQPYTQMQGSQVNILLFFFFFYIKMQFIKFCHKDFLPGNPSVNSAVDYHIVGVTAVLHTLTYFSASPYLCVYYFTVHPITNSLNIHILYVCDCEEEF